MDSNVVITETPDLTSIKVSDFSSSNRFTKENLLKYGLIILVLAFLGFNLFTYLGKATEETAGVFGQIFKKIGTFFGMTAGTVVKQTVDTSAQGVKLGADVAAGTVKSGVNVLEDTLTGKKQRNKIDDNSKFNDTQDRQPKQQSEPAPDQAGSRTQSNRSSGKSGYCLIGEDQGIRSCVRVGEGDTCMSGDIFPSNEICVNPNLRA